MAHSNAIDSEPQTVFWVGVGSSAGGVEALRVLVHQLRRDNAATYIVAHHLAPRHPSLLTDIIARETPLPVIEISNGMVPQRGSIYIAPPNAHVVVSEGRLTLLPHAAGAGKPVPSIDLLFESLAVELGERSIGIILSGAGKDGARGTCAIREHGGITVVQDRFTADYAEMPQAARDTGDVDLVLSPDVLGAEFKTLLQLPRDLHSLMRSTTIGDSLKALMELLSSETGVDFGQYRDATVKRHIKRRMDVTGANTLAQYVHLSTQSPEEVRALYQELLVSVARVESPASADGAAGPAPAVSGLPGDVASVGRSLNHDELLLLNEALQSRVEQLQIANEELATTSQELKQANDELSTVNRGQRNILDCVVTPTIVVDPLRCIVDWSVSAAPFVGDLAGQERPPVADCNMPDGFPPLDELVRFAIASRESVSRHVTLDEHDALVSVAPYHDLDGQLLGAIVQISDNTDALQKIKDELQLIFENVPLAVVLCDEQGRVVNANANAHEWLGRREMLLDGVSIHDVLPPSLSAQINNEGGAGDTVREALDGNDVTFRAADSGHAERWIRTRRVPFRQRDTGATMQLWIFEDVTAKQEEELHTEFLKARMEQALDASMIGTFSKHTRTSQLYWSERFKDIVGKPQDYQPAQGDFYNMLTRQDRELFIAAEQDAVHSGNPYNVQLLVTRDDNEQRHVRARGRLFQGAGMEEQMIGTLLDETELVGQLSKLKEQNNHLQLAEQLSETGYWSVDLVNGQMRNLFLSKQVYEIYGVSDTNFIPTFDEVMAFYHPDDVEMVRSRAMQSINEHVNLSFTARLRNPRTGDRAVRVLAVVQEDGTDGAHRMFGVIRDITETVQREQRLRSARDELARSNEELNRFSYVCSHDMKEPVRLIESMSALMQEDDIFDDKDSARQLMRRINTNTRRLRGIIDSLLAYSRVDSKVESEAISLNGVAGEIMENLSLLIENRQPEILIEDLPEVTGARVHFLQLIQNLVGNALAYNDKSVPKIRISAAHDTRSTVLIVEDNGPGVPAEHRSEIFDVFKRLELGSASEGSGLGLSICQRIVRQYGGTITCKESDLGGARFVIRLPEATGRGVRQAA